MSYLDIARSVGPDYEINERNEISPASAHTKMHNSGTDGSAATSLGVPCGGYERNEKTHRDCLSTDEAIRLGLDPTLVWVRVSHDEVEASKPPADWDGALPTTCRWRTLCEVLGPCPRQQAHGVCPPGGGAP